MLFAAQGKKFDYDLKKLRSAGDFLMELGAGVELVTAAVSHLFLPLTCAANVAKVLSLIGLFTCSTYKKYGQINFKYPSWYCAANLAKVLSLIAWGLIVTLKIFKMYIYTIQYWKGARIGASASCPWKASPQSILYVNC
ncbi:protein root UVB sensitive 6 [Dorcoceras hygrometricum]|uniref:Protein root UVB sensitive 6 n=1 Tax=Dorcoceras hygrometricum TaxID=472368 RepID=A0A2Z7C657_9LAMI|nr:protein root UVB sensitive 6 [Dorcoceras hygrometricum]